MEKNNFNKQEEESKKKRNKVLIRSISLISISLFFVVLIVLIPFTSAIQSARPNTDFSQGGWTDEGGVDNDGDLYTSLDEETSDGDDSYVLGENGDGTFQVNLSGVTDPDTALDHVLHLNCTASGSGGGEKIDIILMEGSTVIHTKNNYACDRDGYVDMANTLSEGQADSINDYTALSVKVIEDSIGGGEYIRITQIYLEVPDVAGDTDSPQWFDNSTNGTVAGTYIEHRVRWTDTALDGYIFSFDNGTGTLANDSWVSMTGANNWSNVSKVVNLTESSTIRWQVYANDTAENGFNATDVFQYDTTSAQCWADSGDLIYVPSGCLMYIPDGEYIG